MAIEDLMTGGTVLPITRWGTPVMHEETKPVTEFDDELHQLVRDMFATMRAARGVGLAATQVGLGISLFVYECPDADDKIHVGAICNPVVTTPTGADVPIEERSADEVTLVHGREGAVRITASAAANPAFDVTPARLVTAYITERGVSDRI